MIPLQCKQSTRVSRDYFKMRFDLSERIIWAGPNTMIYFHYTWKKNNYCRIHHLWIRQSVLNVDNVIVIAALLYNNLAMTSPYWCPPSRLCLSTIQAGSAACRHSFVWRNRQVRLDFSLGRILPNGLWLASGAHASVSPSAADWTPRGETHIQSKAPWDCWPDTKLPLFGACAINDYVTYGIMVK